MKAKSFQRYLEKRLNKDEINEIERMAQLEVGYLRALQEDVSKAVAEYMVQEGIGFNELVRRLDISPTQVAKIQNGKANLTLATIAHIFALLKMKPHLVIHKKNGP